MVRAVPARSTTNQLGFVTHYGYDGSGHKIAETNANN
jgi:YD repeat-containing protein